MAKTKPYRKVVKVMKANGWKLDHTEGSHEIYVKMVTFVLLNATRRIFLREL